MARNALLYTIVVSAAVALILNLTGFLSPGWLVVKHANTGIPFGKDYIEVPKDKVYDDDYDVDDDGKDAPLALPKTTETRRKRETDPGEFIPTEKSTYNVGIWFARRCQKYGSMGAFMTSRRRKCRCETMTVKEVINIASYSEFREIFALPLNSETDYTEWKRSISRLLIATRVEAAVSLVATIVGVVFSLIICKKVENCRGAAIVAAVAMGISGIVILLPVAKLGIVSQQAEHLIDEQTSMYVIGTPYAAVISGFAGVTAVLCMGLIIIYICKKYQVADEPRGWKRFSNEKPPSIISKQEPVLVINYPQDNADSLPEKMPIEDFVNPDENRALF